MPPSASYEICNTPAKHVRRPLTAGDRYAPQKTTTLDKVMQRYYDRQRVMRMNTSHQIQTSTSGSSRVVVGNDVCLSSSRGEAATPSLPSAALTAPQSGETKPSQPEHSEKKEETRENAEPQQPNGIDHLRKAGVAVAGGALVGIGAVLVPLPIPAGFLTMGAGMAVLGTEFPEAQRVFDDAVDKVKEVLEPTDEKGDEVERMTRMEGATYALKKQAEKLGQHVFPLIHKESSSEEEKQPDCDDWVDVKDIPSSEVEES